MHNAVYLAIVLWFIRRILRKDTPAAPVKAPDDTCDAFRYTPGEIENLLIEGLRFEIQQEIDRRLATKLPSWKEFI